MLLRINKVREMNLTQFTFMDTTFLCWEKQVEWFDVSV